MALPKETFIEKIFVMVYLNLSKKVEVILIHTILVVKI